MVSTLNARRQWEVTGNWNLLSETTRLPAFAVDPQKFDAMLREREELDRDLEDYVEHLQLPTLRLFYEDSAAERRGVCGEDAWTFSAPETERCSRDDPEEHR